MWIKLILVAKIFFTVGQSRSDAGIHSSRACFATPGSCSFHRLDKCKGNQKIAIVDAYHTDNTECGMQGCPENITIITESQNRTQLSKSQLTKVDEACTYKTQCQSEGQQGPSLQRFSVLKYKCMDDENEIGSCNGDTKQGSDISLLFVPGSLQTSCSCFIRTVMDDPQVMLDVYLLNMNLPGEPCTNISTLIDGKMLSYTCTTPITPSRLLANGTLQRDGVARITIENPGSSKNIWIQVKGTNELTVNCRSTGTTTPAAGQSSTTGPDEGVDVGAVAGGVTVTALVILAVVLVLLWFKYQRNQRPKGTHSIGKTQGENYSMATCIQDHNSETEAKMKKESMNNYDYATVAGEVNHNKREAQSPLEEDYGHMSDKRPKERGHFDTTLLTAKSYNNKSFTENEDDYNHLAANEKPKTVENGVNFGGYDTAASASKSVQHIRSKGVSDIDSDCDYNHIDNNPKPKPLQGDYDTTASASKAVAKMMETNEKTEDDYDHFRQTKAGSQAADSPYDTAEHHAEHSGDYSIAGVLHKNDPYDLAK